MRRIDDRLHNPVMFVECIFGLAGQRIEALEKEQALVKAPRDRWDAWVEPALIDDFMEFIVQCRQISGAIRNPLLSIEVRNFQPLVP